MVAPLGEHQQPSAAVEGLVDVVGRVHLQRVGEPGAVEVGDHLDDPEVRVRHHTAVLGEVGADQSIGVVLREPELVLVGGERDAVGCGQVVGDHAELALGGVAVDLALRVGHVALQVGDVEVALVVEDQVVGVERRRAGVGQGDEIGTGPGVGVDPHDLLPREVRGVQRAVAVEGDGHERRRPARVGGVGDVHALALAGVHVGPHQRVSLVAPDRDPVQVARPVEGRALRDRQRLAGGGRILQLRERLRDDLLRPAVGAV